MCRFRDFPPLVQLKPGIDESPLFIAHGLGGSAMDFFQPIRYLKTVRPVMGCKRRAMKELKNPSITSRIWRNIFSRL